MKGNELVMAVSSMNNSARAGMDLMVRDLLQVGSGLPSSHAVSIPNGNGAQQIRIPGPPGMATFQTEVGDLVLPALMPRSGQGPTIDGVATDVLVGPDGRQRVPRRRADRGRRQPGHGGAPAPTLATVPIASSRAS